MAAGGTGEDAASNVVSAWKAGSAALHDDGDSAGVQKNLVVAIACGSVDECAGDFSPAIGRCR